AVGPVAVVSLMTASAVGQITAQGTADYLVAAVALALLSGGMLVVMGIFRLGFLANFLSHPVISGFITASGLLIAAGQLGHILGVAGGGNTLPEIVASLSGGVAATNPTTLAIGAGVLAFLVFARKYLKPLLARLPIPARLVDMVTKAAPILAVAATIALVSGFDLGGNGVALVGHIPQGLPAFGMPALSLDLVSALAGPAFLISVVGFVESISVGQTLAAKRRQRIDPDQELIGLGAAN